jgi:hypothetical protein
MAKKKENGNLGLIITLVFFVLATVILGVTTYMGFSQQDEKDKAVAKMKQESDQDKKDAQWRRFQARYTRAMMGAPEAGAEAAELARDLQAFNSGSLSYAGNQKDKDDFEKFVKTTNARLPWDPAKSAVPSVTVESFSRSKDQEIDGLKNELKTARGSANREARERAEAEQAFQKDLASAKAAIEDLKRKSNEDRKKDLDDINAKTDQYRKENEIAGDLRKKLDEAMKELDKLNAQARKLQTQVATATRENRDLKEQLEDKRTQLASLIERTGQDSRVVETQVQDARAMQALKDWKNDWRIVAMDQRGTMPYINLGSADNLSPQVTFSIHAAGTDGRLNPIAKGTAEVVRIAGSHLAQVRITSVKDAKRDPIVRGDRLFNPTWDPSRKRHVAIAGLADLNGDSTDATDELRRLLGRQGVEIDAYIDAKDEKAPKLVGKGVTTNTDFLILGDSLDAVGHPRARDKEYSPKFDKLLRELKDAAASNGVTVISLKKYLEMIGYRSPKVTSNAR